MKIRWTQHARQDVLSIGRYIARLNPQAARALVEKFRQRMNGISQMPFSGRQLPELEREDVRELIERNYRIVYRVKKDESVLEVLTVFEAHRMFSPDDLDIQ